MGYVYDSLKLAIGGSANTNSVIKNWSPNEIRAIYIMRACIVVAYYTKDVKYVNMDQSCVAEELKRGRINGNLNNLLENRQLSCMEEIYVDSVFAKFPALIDLPSYIRSAYNQASRLRAYGYVTINSLASVVDRYKRALVEGEFDLLMCNEGLISGNIAKTDNKEWYKKHNLRPQYYALDGERGKLSVYFNKCEAYMEKSKRDEEAVKTSQIEMENVAKALEVDYLFYSTDLKPLNYLMELSEDCDELPRLVCSSVRKQMGEKKAIEGLTNNKCVEAVRYLSAKSPNVKRPNGGYLGVVRFYSLRGSFSTSNKGIVKEDWNKGIYNIEERLDEALFSFVTNCRKRAYLLHLSMVLRTVKKLPKGKFSTWCSSKFKWVEVTEEENGYLLLLDVVYGMCGYRKSEFLDRVIM